MINNSIFKTYDVRGIYPEEINKETAFRIGAALVVFLSRELKKPEKEIRILLGRDARLSSPILSREFIKGVNSQGGKIINLGLVSSDLLYFSLSYFPYEGGVMITASHNPKEYNGFKIFSSQTTPIYQENGLERIKELAGEKFLRRKKTSVVKKNLLPFYLKYLLNLIDPQKIKPLKVVVDAGHGPAGKIIRELSKKLPFKLFPLYFKPNGRFPKRSPNPKEKNALKACQEKIKEKKADFGLSFDGDGDRTVFLDEKGKIISASLVIALFVREYLSRKKEEKIVYTGDCSQVVPETILQYQGKPIRSITGYPFVRENMRYNEAVLGGENSGHLFFRDVFYNESGGRAFLLMLEILSQDNYTLSELIAEFKHYPRQEENFKIYQNKEEIIEKLAHFYHQETQWQEDGLTVQGKNWWFNARFSNTEPILRLTVEADNEKKVQKELSQIKKILTQD
jgi:phosphomannomutase